MKKKALKKEFRVEIRKSLNRFLSILFIVALGVMIFAGVHASAPDMRATGDSYFDETNLMDLRVLSTLGITEADIEVIAEVDGIEAVYGSYMEDVYCQEEDSQEVLHIEAIIEGVNELIPSEGGLPSKAGECFLDAAYAEEFGYQVGDILDIRVDSEDDSTLVRRSYTISGYGYSSSYISFSRGSTTLGTGSLSGFVYVLPEEFDSEVYSVAYMHVAGAKEQTEFTDGYDELVDAALKRVEQIADGRCEIRYQEVMEEAQSELDEAKQDVADGRQELEDAKKELEEGKAEAQSELAEAESELKDGEQQLADGKKELEDAKAELAEGERELTDGEQEIAQNAQTLTDAQTQISEARQKLQSGESEYQSGLDEFEASQPEAQAQLEEAKQQIEEGKTQLESGWTAYNEQLAALETGESQIASAEAQLDDAQAQYDSGKAQLDAAKSEYDQQLTVLTQGKNELASAETALAQKQEEYGQKRSALDAKWTSYRLSKDSVDQALAQLETEEVRVENLLAEYQNASAAVQALENETAGLQTQINDLSAAIADLQQQKTELEQQKNTLMQEKAELEQQQKKPDLSKEELDRLANTIAEKDQELTQKDQAITQKEQAITQQTQNLGDIQNSLAQKQGELETAKQICTQKQTEYETVAKQVTEQKIALTQQSADLEQTADELNVSEAELTAAKQELDSTSAALAGEKQQLTAAQTELAAAKQELDAGYNELAKTGQQITDGRNELNAQKQELESGKAALAQAKTQLEASQSELDAGQAQVDAGYAKLTNAQKQLKSARKELDLGWAQLGASQKQVANGKRQLEDGRRQLADARTALADGVAQIQEAEEEIAENEAKLKDGWEEYEEGKNEAEEEIAEGEQKIKDAEEELLDAEEQIQEAEEELAKLKFPKWYVDDRSVLQEHTGFGENADRLTNIAQVFPLLFFLVAALISLTTMTRMVEEERTQIGTLKALGYSQGDIAGKYLKYAFWATVGGSLLGILIGEKFLPWVIIKAYGIMYIYLPEIIMPYHWDFGLRATAIALFCTIGATMSSCYRALQTVPAQLMRPPAPKVGKKILLEYIPFIWNHLSFSWKSAIRNLMRYKKRCMMTMIGIGGCMGLLLVGYGLRDSIMDIALLQFSNLQTYDVMVVLDSEEEDALEAFMEQVTEDARISQQKLFYMQSQTIQSSEMDVNREWSVYLYVPENTEGLSDFLTFQDRNTKETYKLTDEGAIITEKVAAKLGIEPGDVILLEDEDGESVEIPIAAVCENYLSHYLYLTPTLYEQIYGEVPEYNSLFFKSEESQEMLEKIGASLLENEAVLNVTYTRTMADQVEDMLVALNSVMIVFIGAAGALAFVVLYNLNNININERRRELATLKVLGFFDGEVGAYVYRENIVLTIAGILLGCLIGKVLHMYIITTVEVDSCMFGRQIKPVSFLIGTLFTAAFSVIVNWVMYFKLKKINMVESLKSIE